MKVRKAIKRIAALGVGATMIGATMMGALAADLNQYPGLFIKDGQFQGVLVIGKEAQATDTIGMTNVALGLQAAAKTCTQVCGGGGSGTVTVDDGVELGNDDIFYNTAINAVTGTVDAGDLDFLADGTYDDNEDADGDGEENEVDFEQEIVIGANVFNFYQDDDDFATAGPALLLDNGLTMYTYKLIFDDSVEYTDSSDDFQGTTLDIQGRTYTITKARFDGTALDEITLQAGETSLWLTKGDDPLDKTIGGVDHTIEVVGVNQAEDKCLLRIDGISTTIDKGSTRNVGGVEIGVIDVVAVNTAGGQTLSPDMCRLTLGADEIVLKNGENVEINGDEVEDSEVTIDAAAGTPGTWDQLWIAYEPADDVYLAAGDGFIDPVFQNFKFYFANLKTSAADEISFTASSRDGEVRMLNSDGNELVFDLRLDGSNVVLGDGDDDDDRIFLQGQTFDYAGTDITEVEGARFLFVTSNEAHIMEIKQIDVDDETMDLYDHTDKRELNDKDITVTQRQDGNSSYFTVALGSGYSNIRFNTTTNLNLTNADLLIFDSIGGTTFETEEEMDVTVAMTANNVTFTFTEYEDNEDNTDPAQYKIDALKDSDDTEIEFAVTRIGSNFAATGVSADDSSDADTIDVTEKGGWVRYNTDDDEDNFVDIMHYRDSVYAQIFVAPTGASSSGGSTQAGCTESCTVNPIPSTANKFDTEVSSATAQNVIAIGGPCANSITSALLNNPEVCYEGFEAGKALIKLVETGDKVALIVAGGTGMDTQLASRILQNYGQYKLEGKEMMATTVSESSLKVDKVQ